MALGLYSAREVLAGPSGVFLSVAVDGILDVAVSEDIQRPEVRKIMAHSLTELRRC